LHTILHRTDLIVFPLTLQTITTAPMMSIWGKGVWYKTSHSNQLSRLRQAGQSTGKVWWCCFRLVRQVRCGKSDTTHSTHELNTWVVGNHHSCMIDHKFHKGANFNWLVLNPNMYQLSTLFFPSLFQWKTTHHQYQSIKATLSLLSVLWRCWMGTGRASSRKNWVAM